MKTDNKPPYTPTQGRYLAFIKAYTDGYGLPPAESDIATAMKVSPPSVNQMMKTLQSKGFILRQPGVPRSIEILLPDDLPKWKGRMPPRIVRQWAYVGPPNSSAKEGTAKKASTVYRFKITLRDTRPSIYRVIETTDVSIERFHELIQTAMGWTNSHLHQFEVDGERFTDPRFLADGFDDFGAVDYQGLKLSNWISPDTKKWNASYEYDFGDGWMHNIELEGHSDAESSVKYPRCIEGSRACPPEDIGGVWGFVDYVKAITDPSDEEHEHYMEWSGPYDPAAFSISAATRRMRTRMQNW